MKILPYLTILFVAIGIVATIDFVADQLAPAIVSNDDNCIHFVWNDDEESIPMDGSFIRIEFTDENTVYLSPVEPREESLLKEYTDKLHRD